jgi:hypothetical protein
MSFLEARNTFTLLTPFIYSQFYHQRRLVSNIKYTQVWGWDWGITLNTLSHGTKPTGKICVISNITTSLLKKTRYVRIKSVIIWHVYPQVMLAVTFIIGLHSRHCRLFATPT